ncbi:hypothetical protein ACSQ6I_16910 [Anabaena sp. WFMT]|uniref:hypothetical protein n=1 Tax=Anabaena sp. WFMT TaxID=3449730 RepID=UPI003F24341D
MFNKELIEQLMEKFCLSHIDKQNTLITSTLRDEKTDFEDSCFLFDNSLINQCYRISMSFKESDIHLLISINSLFMTKYDPLILYEYYHTLNSSGYLLIVTECEPDLTFLEIHKNHFRFINQLKLFIDKKLFCLCLQKISTTNLSNQSDIKKWTFSYITNGTKNDFINTQIQRIETLGLLEWEVIICGKYELPLLGKKHIKYIPFSENDDKGWITKKKNLICEKAKYENLVILHDRYIIPLDFVEKMEQWGNDFDLLGAKQIYYPSHLDPTPVRCQDWMTYARPLETEKKDRSCDSVGILEPQDWDQWCYITGGIYIVKRSLMLKVPQDESLFWNEVEDIKFCHDFTKAGYLVRFNPYLEFESVSYRWPALVIQYSQNPHQLGIKTTSKETLLYWYFYLLDYLLVYKEIKTALHQLGSDFLQKIKSVVVNDENLELHQVNLSTVKNIRELNNGCIDILNTPSVCQAVKDIDIVTQTHLAFNLVLGRRPSPYEEYIWGSKNLLFVNMVSDLLYETEFQYRIRTLARSIHISKTGDILVIRCLSVVKPLILIVIMTSINLTRNNLKRFNFIKKIIKKIMFYMS